ncbi:hypothetical protein PMAYCL1PPCAC_04424, partial [Pristionchus mayeri]
INLRASIRFVLLIQPNLSVPNSETFSSCELVLFSQGNNANSSLLKTAESSMNEINRWMRIFLVISKISSIRRRSKNPILCPII